MEGFNLPRTLLLILGWGAFMAGAAYLDGRTTIGNGLLAGALTGAISFVQLHFQIKKSAKMQPDRAAAYIQAGWLLRLLLIVAVLIVSILMPQVSFMAALAGFFMIWFALLGAIVLFVLKQKRV